MVSIISMIIIVKEEFIMKVTVEREMDGMITRKMHGTEQSAH